MPTQSVVGGTPLLLLYPTPTYDGLTSPLSGRGRVRKCLANPLTPEDNHYVYGELLGMLSQEIIALADEGVI
jgi:hypothetical protein